MQPVAAESDVKRGAFVRCSGLLGRARPAAHNLSRPHDDDAHPLPRRAGRHSRRSFHCVGVSLQECQADPKGATQACAVTLNVLSCNASSCSE